MPCSAVYGIEATRLLAVPGIDDPLAVVVSTTFDTDKYVSAEIADELHISLSTAGTVES